MGEHDKALEVARKVLEESTRDHSHSKATAFSSMGYVLSQMGRMSEAEQHLKQSILHWEEARDGLGDSYMEKARFLDLQSYTYDSLLEMYVTSGRVEEALEVAESGRSRGFAESFLQRRGDASHRAPNLESIRRIAKQSGATLVEYAILHKSSPRLLPIRVQGSQGDLEKMLLIWVVRPDGSIVLREVDLEGPREKRVSLASSVKRTYLAMTAKSADEFAQDRLKDLYDRLVAPISDLLPKEADESVVFVPHGPLFQVPFSALLSPAGRFLVEDHTVFVAPSIGIFGAMKATSSSLARRPDDVLVVGNPKSPMKLSNLAGAESEAEAVAESFGTRALTGAEATKEKVLAQIGDDTLIHLAGHGLQVVKEGIPGALALASADGKGDGLLTAAEIRNLELQADLVVLSACDTGRGLTTSDGVFGLARAFLIGGAESVMVSLWQVPDAQTSELMKAFYEYLREGSGPAHALRRAMLGSMEGFKPYEWAGFTVIGR